MCRESGGRVRSSSCSPASVGLEVKAAALAAQGDLGGEAVGDDARVAVAGGHGAAALS
jgi:hypothetical protein